MISSTISIDEIKFLVNSVPGLGWAAWPNGDFICQSTSMEEYTGLPSSKFVQRDPVSGEYAWSELVHADDYGRLENAWLDAVQSRSKFDVAHRVRTATGSFRWLRTTARAQATPEGEIIYWLGTCLDIHDAVTEMEASREREKALNDFIEAVPTPIWAADDLGRPIYFNKSLRAQVGIEVDHSSAENRMTLDEILSRVIHPDDLGSVSEALKATFAGGPRFKHKYRQVRAGGGFRWTKGEANGLPDGDGVVRRWLGVAQDIDDEVAAQAAISEREARLALIIETMPGLLWVSSPDGQPSYFSRQLEEWSGLNVEQITPGKDDALKTIIDLTIHPDHRSDVETTIRHSFKSGEPWFSRFRQRRFDGTWRWLEARMAPLRDDKGEIIQWYGLQVDIENEYLAQESLRALQDKLSRASRYAGMAELSASIAHELSQPLASVIMSADACRRWLEMTPPNLDRAKHSANCVVRDAHISSEVVKRIRALFQRRSEERVATDINVLIESVRELMAEGLTAAGVSLNLELASELDKVSVDVIQIQQVLVNLLHNAAEAISSVSGGDRIISVKTVHTPDGPTVEVADTGNGIQDIDRIFMPFFTTKETGMGMGLSICESIITSHGGRIWAENAPRGARVKFTLSGAHIETQNAELAI